MVTVAVEVAKKVGCVVCGRERFALKSPYVCHSCWASGEAALMIQRLTQRAADLPYVAGYEPDSIEIDGRPVMITVKPSANR